MNQFRPSEDVYISYDSSLKSLYITLHADQRFPAKVQTETINDIDNGGPLINIDRIGETIVGIEIIL